MAGITLAGTDVTLEGRGGESVSQTLLRAGYTMRLACRGGSCGLCRVHVDDGQTTYTLAVAESALTREDHLSGVVLACRAVPVSDITISLPTEANLRHIAPQVTPFALRTQPPTGRGDLGKEVAMP